MRSFKYLGVRATTPPNYKARTRAPLTTDIDGVTRGDFWSNENNEDVWILTSKANNIATWTKLNNSGDITNLTVTTGPFIVDYFTAGTLRSSAAGVISSLADGSALQVYMGSTGAAEWGTLTSTGTTVSITRTPTGINFESAGGTAVTTFEGDNGLSSGPDGAGNINIFGGVNITTSAGLIPFTVTINLDNGTQGQVLIGSNAGDSAWANLTSTNGTVTITEGNNTLDFEANGLQINEQLTTAYQLVASDAGKQVTVADIGAITLTIPDHATVPFITGTIIAIVQGNSGTITLTPAAGVTLRSAGGMYDLYEKYSACCLIKQSNSTWLAVGDLRA